MLAQMEAVDRLVREISCIKCEKNTEKYFIVNMPCNHLLCTECYNQKNNDNKDKICIICNENIEKCINDESKLYGKLYERVTAFKQILLNKHEKKSRLLDKLSSKDIPISSVDKSTDHKIKQRKCQPNKKNTSKNILIGGISNEEKEILKEKIISLNGKYCDEFSSSVTHMIVQTNEENVCVRTIKYLYALSSGCYIVNRTWLDDSSREGKWLDELPFLVKGCKDSTDNTPSKVLTLKAENKKGIFQNCLFFIRDQNKVPSNSQLSQLIELCDGKVVNNLSTFKKKASKSSNTKYYVLITQEITEQNDSKSQNNIIHKPIQWMLKCVADMELKID